MGIFLVGVLAAHGVGDSGDEFVSKERMQAACQVEYCYEIILLILFRSFHPGSFVVRVQLGIEQLVCFVNWHLITYRPWGQDGEGGASASAWFHFNVS